MRIGVLAVCLAATLGSTGVRAADGRDVGTRLLVLAGDGVPANDMPGFGVGLRWAWREGWYVGAGLDLVEFDYERPNDVLGIPSSEEIDGSNEFTRIRGWIERVYDEQDGGWSWSWQAGLGYAAVDPDEVQGPTTGGGTYDIVTDAEDELHVLFAAGVRRNLGDRWFLEVALHLEHHATEYTLTDRVSGVTGSIGSQTPWGASAGLNYRF
jgi:hypothetical protein